jgi:CheY-specific phosphatase CheX
MQPAHFEPQIQNRLQEALNEVLEAMCYLSSEDATSDERQKTEHWVGRRLDFRGPRDGRFGLRTPLPTARVIASNFLGEELEDITDDQAGEVIGEVANMVCGTFLASIDSHQAFDLTTPRPDDQREPASLNRVAHAYALDEGELVVWLEI